MKRDKHARAVFTENLRGFMSTKGITQADIVNHLKLTASTVSDWVTGKKYPRVDSMQQLADFLNVRMSDLMTSEEKQPVPKGLEKPDYVVRPLLGAIACGKPITAEENIEEYVQVLASTPCDFLLKCKGDSMAPRIQNGDTVMIRKQSTVENGQTAAVMIDDEATLKRVYFMPDGVQLVAENAEYPPMLFVGDAAKNVHIIGRATAFLRGLK